MKLTGGTAFPTNDNPVFSASEGMTLRDYFAAKAMQGMQARINWRLEEVSRLAYEQADAMLKAREHGNS